MQINIDQNRGAYYIRSYKPGEIQINDEKIHTSVILTLNECIHPWPPHNMKELQAQHLQMLLRLDPQIVLLGTGEKTEFPAPELLSIFYDRQIGVEVMDTLAACRTYNILTAESRRVVAGLLVTP